MKPYSLLVAFGISVLAGCETRPSRSETPADHPAHPTAAEAPAPQPSAALRDPATTRPAPAEADAAEVVYTCPHHPEVVSDKPGVCPKCDMKLQPQKDAPSPAPGGGDAHQGHGGHGGHR